MYSYDTDGSENVQGLFSMYEYFLLKKTVIDKILHDLNDLSILVNTELLIRAVYSNYEMYLI